MQSRSKGTHAPLVRLICSLMTLHCSLGPPDPPATHRVAKNTGLQLCAHSPSTDTLFECSQFASVIIFCVRRGLMCNKCKWVMYILHFISPHFSLASYTVVMPPNSCYLVYQKAPKMEICCCCYWLLSSEKSRVVICNYLWNYEPASPIVFSQISAALTRDLSNISKTALKKLQAFPCVLRFGRIGQNTLRYIVFPGIAHKPLEISISM